MVHSSWGNFGSNVRFITYSGNLVMGTKLSKTIPIGLSRKGDRRRPDGLTYTTWKNGKCLIWDFTCADTLCKSYVKKASKEVGSAAARREEKKVDKYSNLSDYFHFFPVGIDLWCLRSSRPQASQTDQ